MDIKTEIHGCDMIFYYMTQLEKISDNFYIVADKPKIHMIKMSIRNKDGKMLSIEQIEIKSRIYKQRLMQHIIDSN